jgi:hypothetical protein
VENHPATAPAFYAGLLHRVYTTSTVRTVG